MLSHTLRLTPLSLLKPSSRREVFRMLSHEVGFSSPPAAYRPQKGVVGVSCVPVPHAPIHDSGCEKLKEATKNGSEGTGSAGWPLVVVSFYKFASLPDCQEMRAPLRELCETHRVSGGIILAEEGINGSICGTREAVESVMSAIQSDERLANIRRTEAPAGPEDEELHHGHTSKSPLGAGENAPFRWDHVRIKIKKEDHRVSLVVEAMEFLYILDSKVVSMGVSGVDPFKNVGKYVKPKDWNKLISDPNTVVVDVRNSYEIRIGKFRRAIDPQTDSFREFPAWVDEHLPDAQNPGFVTGIKEGEVEKNLLREHETDVADEAISGTQFNTSPSPRRIAMYCTGGIRCEKATSLLVHQGFDEVYHLEGGILKYLEETPPTESLWEGECFVFDKRVAVGHALKQGSYGLCYACKKPVNATDMESTLWEEGVSCPYCFHRKSAAEKTRARARHNQFLRFGVIGGPDKGRPTMSASKQRSLEYPEREHYFSMKSN